MPSKPPDSVAFGTEAPGVIRLLGQHLVCLGITYIALDEDGRRTGPERFFSASGFIMSFQDEWYYVTAGHVLKQELDHRLSHCQLEITRAVLVPSFGSLTVSRQMMQSMPIPYADMPRAYIDDRELGLDIGFIHLRKLFRDGLEGFGVRAITEEQWQNLHLVGCDFYCMIGFPAAFTTGEVPEDHYGEAMNVSVQATLMSLRKLEEMPEGSNPSTLPWFIGQMPNRAVPFDIRGMSGCPIFGFRMCGDGRMRYWIVALQSRRSNSQREIVLACPVHVFAPLIENVLIGSSENSGDQ